MTNKQEHGSNIPHLAAQFDELAGLGLVPVPTIPFLQHLAPVLQKVFSGVIDITPSRHYHIIIIRPSLCEKIFLNYWGKLKRELGGKLHQNVKSSLRVPTYIYNTTTKGFDSK